MKLKLVLLFVILFTTSFFRAQNTTSPNLPKKIGLCLSGGGAKGLAHIGLLKLIDSLGIKVDYITGTSMGSVVGGLYAAGWSGKQIDSIAHVAHWDVLLNQYVPMNEIYIDEKDEYNKYIGEIAIRNGKLNLTGFIEGQTLLNLFTKLTQHVSHIHDFSKLPIPFKCMTVDIVKVEPVVMDHGNLAIAMRSSMSIPTVFKPVNFENKLLVDGGLMVNFPVEQLKEMGADYVIGSYTGGRLLEEKEMNTVMKLLMQTSNFYGINEAQDDIKLCDIFNNLTANMKTFSAGDFKKSNQIMAKGDEIARNVLPQLVQLSTQLKATTPEYAKQNLVIPNRKIKINNIKIDTITNKHLLQFTDKRFYIDKGDSVTHQTLAKNIKRVFGTRNFYKAYYELNKVDSSQTYDAVIKVQQDDKFRLKGAMHYDTELGAGFLFNVTARNWLGKTSRLFATVDLSQFFKYRVQYRKYIGQTQLSFNTEFLREKSGYKDYGDNGKKAVKDFFNVYRSFNMGLNYNLAMPTSIYAGVYGEIYQIDQKYSTQNINVFNMNNMSAVIIGLKFRHEFNTLNHPFFPKRGIKSLFEFRHVLVSAQDANYTFATLDTATYEPTSVPLNSKSDYTGYEKLYYNFKGLIPIHPKLSAVFEAYAGFTWTNKKAEAKADSTLTSDIPYLDRWSLGGITQRAKINQIPLMGINENQYNAPNFTNINVGLQLELIRKLFITPAFSYVFIGSQTQEFFTYLPKVNFDNKIFYGAKGGYYESFYTYGLLVAYRSPLGPITVNVAKSSIYKNLTGYLSIGFNF